MVTGRQETWKTPKSHGLSRCHTRRNVGIVESEKRGPTACVAASAFRCLLGTAFRPSDLRRPRRCWAWRAAGSAGVRMAALGSTACQWAAASCAASRRSDSRAERMTASGPSLARQSIAYTARAATEPSAPSEGESAETSSRDRKCRVRMTYHIWA